MELQIDVADDAVNEKFLPYLFTTYRYELYWGGRDSSKSDFVALKLLLQCLHQEYFLCVMVREVYATIRDSQWATLKKVAEREGIDHLFFFGSSPLEIVCLVNNNKFIARGMDNASKLKSISDPTHAWYEEANQIDEKSHDIVSTSLRTSNDVPIQEIFTFNPDHEGDYKEFWLYKKFFVATGNESGLSFLGSLESKVEDVIIKRSFMVLHSTIYDNRWAPIERKATYEGYKDSDPYRYKVWAKGLWANKVTGNEFYNKFTRNGLHVKVEKVDYIPNLPVHISIDFNVLPYMTGLCAQVETIGTTWHIRFYREYPMRPPNNSTDMLCAAFVRDHVNLNPMPSVFYYGDASGEKRIPGYGEKRAFDEVRRGLHRFIHSSSDKVFRQNPGVFKRRDFINNIFAGKYDIVVHIDEGCRLLIEDFENVLSTITGKDKKKVFDEALQAEYEKYGHFSDAFDYFICKVLEHLWPYR